MTEPTVEELRDYFSSGRTNATTNAFLSRFEIIRHAPTEGQKQRWAPEQESPQLQRIRRDNLVLPPQTQGMRRNRRRRGPEGPYNIICSTTEIAKNLQELNPSNNVFVLHPIVGDYAYPEWGEAYDDVGYTTALHNSDKGGDIISALRERFPEKQFRYSGGVPNKLMKEFYASLAVLLIPARTAVYSKTTVEAASAGVPVLAADLPGIRETGCAAEYLPVDDLDAWVEAIERYANGDQHLRNTARERYQMNKERQDQELNELILVAQTWGINART